MYLGFRAGRDPDAGITSSDDFVGTRRAWNLPPGTAPIGRVFPSGASVDPTQTPAQVIVRLDRAAAPVLAAHMWPYLSLKPDVGATLAGRLDEHFTVIGAWATLAGVPIYLSFWHEPENNTMGVTSTNYLARARAFTQMHTHAYRVIKAAAGDAVRMGPCHLAYKWITGSPETADGAVAAAWRVPDDARDFIAVDAYTSDWSRTATGATLAEKTDFQRWFDRIDPDPRLLVLAERGITRNPTADGGGGPADQAAILTADYHYLRGLGAHALLYWNSVGANDGSIFQLGLASAGVFRQIAQDAASPPPEDRYREGLQDGRRQVLDELAAWIAEQQVTAAS